MSPRFLILLMGLFMIGCSLPATKAPVAWTPVPPGTLLKNNGTLITETDLVSWARDYDFVLVGESHTNPCDHAVQVRIMEQWAAAQVKFILGLEMLPVTAQEVLDRFNARQISAQDLGASIGWSELWGHPYSLYAPIFALAERENIPVMALNISREALQVLRDNEYADADLKKHLVPKQIIDPSAAQRQALDDQVKMHQKMRTQALGHPKGHEQVQELKTEVNVLDQASARFFRVQAVWDSMMAEQALALHEQWQLPILIFAGSGHVQHGWGIEYRLQSLAPEARCLGIMPVRDSEDWAYLLDESQRALPGETIFYHCAAVHKSRLGMHLVFESEQIRVQSVESGSPAGQAGLQPGDLLMAAGDKVLDNAADLHFAAMAAVQQNQNLILTIKRASEILTLTLPLR